MSLSNYDGLKASVANWLNRTDLSVEIVDFIELAENRIFHEVRLPSNEKTIILNISSDGYATIPSDFLEVKDMFFNYDPIDRVTLSQMHSYKTLSGTPTCFTRETYRFKFFPTPTLSDSDEVRMIYYYDSGRLSVDAPTNPMLSTAPELYLYATLVEAANFLGSDPAKWEAGFQASFGRLLKHSRDADIAGSSPQISNGY